MEILSPKKDQYCSSLLLFIFCPHTHTHVHICCLLLLLDIFFSTAGVESFQFIYYLLIFSIFPGHSSFHLNLALSFLPSFLSFSIRPTNATCSSSSCSHFLSQQKVFYNKYVLGCLSLISGTRLYTTDDKHMRLTRLYSYYNPSHICCLIAHLHLMKYSLIQ